MPHPCFPRASKIAGRRGARRPVSPGVCPSPHTHDETSTPQHVHSRTHFEKCRQRHRPTTAPSSSPHQQRSVLPVQISKRAREVSGLPENKVYTTRAPLYFRGVNKGTRGVIPKPTLGLCHSLLLGLEVPNRTLTLPLTVTSTIPIATHARIRGTAREQRCNAYRCVLQYKHTPVCHYHRRLTALHPKYLLSLEPGTKIRCP